MLPPVATVLFLLRRRTLRMGIVMALSFPVVALPVVVAVVAASSR